MRHALALTLGKLRAVWPTTLRSRFGWAFFASLVVVLSVVLVHMASADALEYVANGMINAIARIMLAIANLAIGLCLFFLKFFIAIASYNNYIDVDVVQLGWVMVRDVANMFFVVVLLVIAFGTILGLEEYEWKKNLVKLILAAIFINFSNLIAQLFIDVAHVFTMTFLNAISATAGGNLISMFKLNEITAMVGVDPAVDTEFNTEILAGTAIAAIFAVMAAMVMGSYVFVMMGRVVSLWALIILSPLAYILGVLPKTKSYAERWWSEFSSNVIVAPIMVFFLWLSFATLGAGDIMTDIQQGIPVGNQIEPGKSVELVGSNFVEKGESSKLSLSKVSTWENMANFLIALAFLRVGVKTTEETGVWGSDMISSAWSFGKDVAKYATGYAAGRWLVGKGQDTLKTGASAALWRAPIVGGRALTNYANATKIGFGKMGIGRDNWAKSLEEPSKKLRDLKADLKRGKITQEKYDSESAKIKGPLGGLSAVTRFGRNILAGVVQTNGRAEKKAEDWAKAVDAQKTYKDENYSTSDSLGGRSKLKWGIMAHAAEEMAGAKKRQKYAIGTDRILARENADFERKVQKKMAGGMSREDAEKEVKAKGLLLLENTTAKARGEADNLEYDLKRHMDLSTAKARAKALRDAGRTAEANSILKSAYVNANEVESKPFLSMSFGERVNQGGKLMEDIMSTNTSDENRTQLRKNALQLLNISAQKGQEEFEAVLNKMLTQLYGNDDYDITSTNASTRIMEAISGVRAQPGSGTSNPGNYAEMQELIDGLHHEKDESQAVMSLFADSLKKLATTGGVKYVGAVYERSTVGDAAAAERATTGGSTAYGFVNMANAGDQRHKAGQEEYFGDKVSTKALLNLDGYLNILSGRDPRTGDRQQTISSIQPSQLNQLISALGNFSDTREVGTAFAATFANQMRKDAGRLSPEAMRQYTQLFNNLGAQYAAKGPEGVQVYQRLINTQFKAIHDQLKGAVDPTSGREYMNARDTGYF